MFYFTFMEGISAETSPGSFTCRTHVACRYVSLFFAHSTVRGPSSLASAGRVGWLMKKCSDSSSFILALFAAVRFDYPFKLGRKRLHLGNDSPVAVHRRIRKDSITSPRDGSRVHTLLFPPPSDCTCHFLSCLWPGRATPPTSATWLL